MQLAWKLPELLEHHKISVYKLRKTMIENDVPISPNTAYRWSKELPETINVAHLEGVLEAMRQLTGEDLTLNELLPIADIEQPKLFDKSAS